MSLVVWKTAQLTSSMCLLFLSGTEPKYDYLIGVNELPSALLMLAPFLERATGCWRYLADKIYL
jgi:hypothetical protein